MALMDSPARCACGYEPAYSVETEGCANCGVSCCLECAYMEAETCAWYCHECALTQFGVESTPGDGRGRVYQR